MANEYKEQNIFKINDHHNMTLQEVFSSCSLTEGQTKLVAKWTQFFERKDDHVFLLKGYAGTGKTFMIKGLVQYLEIKGYHFKLAAPTGKAAKVISKRTGIEAATIHRAIYSFDDIVEYTQGEKGSETYKFYTKIKGSDSSDYVYIVDEASMISDIHNEGEFIQFGSGRLLQDFFKFVNLDHNDHHKKIIFVGDTAQLLPVGMGSSPALDANYLSREYGIKSVEFELKEVVRQKKDSGIMDNSMLIRNAIDRKNFEKISVNLDYPDLEEVPHQDLISLYLRSCNNKISDQSIIIASSNKQVADYNRCIREHFFPEVRDITVGDKVIVVRNSMVKIIHRGVQSNYFISNGDFGFVKSVFDRELRNITLKKKNEVTGIVEKIVVSLVFRRIALEIEGVLDVSNDPITFETLIFEELLYNQSLGLSSDENKALYVDFCMRHPGIKNGSGEFKTSLKADPYFNALQLKFGYAITCHKAQGSEWKNVFVQCQTHHSNQLTLDYFRWLYTAITRASNYLYLVEPPCIKVGFGIKPVLPNGPKNNANIDKNLLNSAFDNAKDSGSFYGISNEAHLSREILERVKLCIKDSDIEISEIEQKQYQDIYFFKVDHQKIRAGIFYNKKGEISEIRMHERTECSQKIYSLISKIKGCIVVLNEEVVKDREFGKEFLNEFHRRVSDLAMKKNIKIYDVKPRSWCQRYTFSRNGETDVFDIFYNGKNRFTKYALVNDASSGSALNRDIEVLLTEELCS